MLQAAGSQVTPRLGRVTGEEELRPVDEAFYHADAHALRHGTPDLAHQLAAEFAKRSTQLHLPNFLGEAPLLGLLPDRSSAGNPFLLGPAPEHHARRKALRQPKKRRNKTGGGEEEQVEDDVGSLAAALAAQQSQALDAQANIPPEDLRMMKEESAEGKPPPPLDDRLALRLEEVWAVLEMPMLDKLAMVVKYSELEQAALMEEALEAWHAGAEAVAAREELLQTEGRRVSLQWDKAADHPDAAHAVHAFTARLHLATHKCAEAAEELLARFGDVLTYRGMPYAEELEGGAEAALERVLGRPHLPRVASPARSSAQAFMQRSSSRKLLS